MIAYKRAIAFIKSLPFEVKSEDDLKDMPTIGEKIKRKVVEIIQTGRLRKADNLGATLKN
jgi:DNA polymerase lambda